MVLRVRCSQRELGTRKPFELRGKVFEYLTVHFGLKSLKGGKKITILCGQLTSRSMDERSVNIFDSLIEDQFMLEGLDGVHALDLQSAPTNPHIIPNHDDLSQGKNFRETRHEVMRQ